METTYRYTRRSRPKGTLDSYDSLSRKYPSQYSQLEYWTNGNTTLLMSTTPQSQAAVPMPMSAAPERVFQNFTTTPPSSTTKGIPSEGAPSESFNVPRRATTMPSSTIKARPSQGTPSESNIVRNSLIAGSLAGIASTSTFYPFEVIRTKCQSAAAHETSVSSSSANNNKARSTLSVSTTTRYRGPIQVLFKTLQHGGIRALYTGMALPVAAQAIYKSTVFSVNKVATKALTEYKTQERRKLGDFRPITLTMTDRWLCGFLGGAINALCFVTPVEYVRNQLIAQQYRKVHGISSSKVHFTGPRDVIRHTISTQGVTGLWKGASMAVARDALGCGCFFFTFHYLSQRLPQDQASSTLIAGAASGLAFWVTALPIDTCKTVVQNGSASSGTEFLVQSLSEHGVVFTAKRLCRGYQVAFARGMPAAAVTVTTYEAAYRYLQQL